MQYFTDPTKLKPQRVISLDTEYSDLDIKKAELLSISVGISDGLAGVFLPQDLPKIRGVLEQAEIVFVQNGKVDFHVLQRHGLALDRSRFIDCMLLEHLVDENVGHSLGEMVFRYYTDNYKKEFWSRFSSYQEAPRQDQLDYEMRDACYTFALGVRFLEQLGISPLIDHVHKLYWALFETEVTGLRVDTDLMLKTRESMGKQIAEYLPKLRADFSEHVTAWELSQWAVEIDKRKTETGRARVLRPQFNFASDAQIRWLLFDSMGCEVKEKTKKGAPKTDYDTILNLSETYPELQTLVQYKDIKNIYATFVEGLLERVETGRIYPSFNINGTRNAGRISHSNPNMGNMPKEGPIRNFFLPESGNVVLGADYSQLEVVVEANLTEDKSLLKIILEGASKHDITAQGLGIPRDQAKTLNFALQYGAGVHKVSKILGVSFADATDIFKRFWVLYSGVKALKDQAAAMIADKGYVTTLFGRKRHFPKPKNEFEKARFERQAYNAIIQGTGADMTNRATWKIQEVLKHFNIGRLWFSVHDEIVVETPERDTGAVTRYLVSSMEESNEFLKLKYPVKAEPYGPFDRWQKA